LHGSPSWRKVAEIRCGPASGDWLHSGFLEEAAMKKLLLLIAVLVSAGCATVVTTHAPDEQSPDMLIPGGSVAPHQMDASAEAIEIFAGEPYRD
jgi:hypothetical protein